jgi:hypothetical protein
MNIWNIPDWLEAEIIARDQCCVYCGVRFTSPRKNRKAMATWEHIVNDARIVTRENIARCCASCNASKGAKQLVVWLDSEFCQRRGITKDSVSEVVKQALIKLPRLDS